MVKKTSLYKIVIQHDNDKYKSEGETILEALEGFDIKPHLIKTKCILTITKGKIKKEQTYTPFQVKRIIKNNMFRKIVSGKLAFLIGDKKVVEG